MPAAGRASTTAAPSTRSRRRRPRRRSGLSRRSGGRRASALRAATKMPAKVEAEGRDAMTKSDDYLRLRYKTKADYLRAVTMLLAMQSAGFFPGCSMWTMGDKREIILSRNTELPPMTAKGAERSKEMLEFTKRRRR